MSNPDLSWLGAFLAGVVSFLSPCILPLVPAYLSFITGSSLEELRAAGPQARRVRTLLAALVFVLGFSVVFILLGATATAAGKWFSLHARFFGRIAGFVLIILGMHVAGWVRIPWLLYENRVQVREKPLGWLGSFLVGAAFAFGWTPCVGPLLAGILALAGTRETLGQGVGLLAWYSAGLGLPFLLAALAVDRLVEGVRRFQRFFHWVEITGGLLLILIGGLMAFGGLSRLAGWFQAFAGFAW